MAQTPWTSRIPVTTEVHRRIGFDGEFYAADCLRLAVADFSEYLSGSVSEGGGQIVVDMNAVGTTHSFCPRNSHANRARRPPAEMATGLLTPPTDPTI